MNTSIWEENRIWGPHGHGGRTTDVMHNADQMKRIVEDRRRFGAGEGRVTENKTMSGEETTGKESNKILRRNGV